MPAARPFHESLPGYAPTPLVSVPELADELGVSAVHVKDESARLGLPAFKVLGASWATARLVSEQTGSGTDLASLRQAAASSGLRLVTATDGNHGRAVAHMARLLGLEATVFVPAVMTSRAADAIAAEEPTSCTPTATTTPPSRPPPGSRTRGQGGCWSRTPPGTDTNGSPAWIVEGYDTMFEEIDHQLGRAPDLVAVPVGVGSLAQAAVTHYRRPGSGRPTVLSVEPDSAACLLASLVAGRLVRVDTGATVMAGLNCGTVSSAAWPVLRAGCDAAVVVSDDSARRAVTELVGLGVSSGPSGAASLAGVRAALVADRRAALGIDRSSTLVLLSTEAALDDA